MSTRNVDPVRLELLKNAMVSICDNMLGLVVRTARSTNIKNTMDFSATICDAEGQLVAQGLAVPAHLGSVMPALRGCLDYFGDDVHEGDVLASNDPYAGGSHLNDIFMFRPVFVAGERIAWLGLILHHTDLGGRVPGGNATDSSEIFQEGLRIPPSKVVERGAPNVTLLRVIEHNTRIPQRMMGDVAAQIATLESAAGELHDLVSGMGAQAYRAHTDELLRYTERLTRARIAALPDGDVQFVDWNDDDGAGSGPIRFQVRIVKRADEFLVDFTGTSPQGRGAVHTNHAFTASCTYAALRTVLDPDMPNNAGFYRAIRVVTPEGSFVNARYPAALGSRGQAGFRIRSVVFGALAQLLPERMPACAGGSEFAVVFAGYEDHGRKPFLHLEFHNNTGQGGGPDRDGQDGGPYCIGNLANVPVELIEAENPILVDEYAFLPDTGGAGRFRGALGIARQYRLLADEATLQLRSDRHLHPCWGLWGGGAGSLARSLLDEGAGTLRETPSKFTRRVARGTVFRAEMAGSGGWGDPLERDPDAVGRDARQGKVTLEHARDAYAVVVRPDTFEIDPQATRRLRAERRAHKETS